MEDVIGQKHSTAVVCQENMSSADGWNQRHSSLTPKLHVRLKPAGRVLRAPETQNEQTFQPNASNQENKLRDRAT